MVLEFLDRQWSTRSDGAPAEIYRPDAVRKTVADARPKATRIVLQRLLDSLVTADGSPSDVLDALHDYGSHLYIAGELTLAAHIHYLATEAARRSRLVPMLPRAHLHLAMALRDIGDNEGALASYRAGAVLADQCNDTRHAVLIAIGEGSVLRRKGLELEALALLRPALRQARAMRDRELIGSAAHELGLILARFDKHINALVCYREAFHAFTLLRRQHRLLNDIGLSFNALNLADSAQDAWLIVHTAIKAEPTAQCGARINLMWKAHEMNDRARFDEYRKAVPLTRVPISMLAGYYYELGRGFSKFGRPEEARRAYARSLGLAQRHKLAKLSHDAREALEGRAREEVRQNIPTTDFPRAVTELVEAIAKLRVTPQFVGWAARDRGSVVSPAPGRQLRTALGRGRRPCENQNGQMDRCCFDERDTSVTM
jgi:tetratricopeptide (TPR) repeat protein